VIETIRSLVDSHQCYLLFLCFVFRVILIVSLMELCVISAQPQKMIYSITDANAIVLWSSDCSI